MKILIKKNVAFLVKSSVYVFFFYLRFCDVIYLGVGIFFPKTALHICLNTYKNTFFFLSFFLTRNNIFITINYADRGIT